MRKACILIPHVQKLTAVNYQKGKGYTKPVKHAQFFLLASHLQRLNAGIYSELITLISSRILFISLLEGLGHQPQTVVQGRHDIPFVYTLRYLSHAYML